MEKDTVFEPAPSTSDALGRRADRATVTAPLSCRLIENRDKLKNIAACWTELLHTDGYGTPFQSGAFCTTWWNHFGNARNRPVLLVCERDGQWLGLAPLYRKHEYGIRYLQVMGDTETADAAWLVRRTEERQSVVRCMLQSLNAMPGWDALRLYRIKSGAFYQAVSDAAAALRMPVRVRDMGNSHFIDLSAGVEPVLAGLSSKLKNTVRKRQRKAAQLGTVTFVSTPIITPREWAWVLEIEKKSWKAQADFRLNTKQAFFAELFPKLAESGLLRFSQWQIDHKAVAYLISLVTPDGRVLAYETAYDKQYAEISPGTLVHYEEIVSLGNGTAREIDFLGGSEQYKSEWTSSSRPVRELVLLRPNLRARVLAAGLLALKWRMKKAGWIG